MDYTLTAFHLGLLARSVERTAARYRTVEPVVIVPGFYRLPSYPDSTVYRFTRILPSTVLPGFYRAPYGEEFFKNWVTSRLCTTDNRSDLSDKVMLVR
jgi:hypothetical protein